MIERLKELADAVYYEIPGRGPKSGYSPCDDIRLKEALTEAWPKLLAVVDAGTMLEARANRTVEYLKSSGHLSEAARLENALKVYGKARAELHD
jgi:hypothetical protein